MKQSVSPAVIAVIGVIALILLGAWAWRNFAPPTARAGKNPYESLPAGAPRGGGPPPVGDYTNRAGGGGSPYGGGPPSMGGPPPGAGGSPGMPGPPPGAYGAPGAGR